MSVSAYYINYYLLTYSCELRPAIIDHFRMRCVRARHCIEYCAGPGAWIMFLGVCVNLWWLMIDLMLE